MYLQKPESYSQFEKDILHPEDINLDLKHDGFRITLVVDDTRLSLTLALFGNSIDTGAILRDPYYKPDLFRNLMVYQALLGFLKRIKPGVIARNHRDIDDELEIKHISKFLPVNFESKLYTFLVSLEGLKRLLTFQSNMKTIVEKQSASYYKLLLAIKRIREEIDMHMDVYEEYAFDNPSSELDELIPLIKEVVIELGILHQLMLNNYKCFLRTNNSYFASIKPDIPQVAE